MAGRLLRQGKDKRMIVQLGLLLIVGAVILLYPYFGLLATMALLPLAYLPALSKMLLGSSFLLTPVKIVGGATFVSAVSRHPHVLVRAYRHPPIAGLAWLLAYATLSGFMQPGSFTQENIINYVAHSFIGLSVLALATSLERLAKVVSVLIGAAFAVSFGTILDYAAGASPMRMSGTALGPNYFAINLLPILGLAFYGIEGARTRRLRYLMALVTLVLSMALITTFSRGGLLGFGAMFVLGFLRARNRSRALVFIGLCCILVAVFVPTYAWERFSRTRIEEDATEGDVISTHNRYLRAQAAWRMFLDNPVFGVGPGNYYWECRKYESGISPGRAHSMHLEVLAELGLVGAGFYLVVFRRTFLSLGRMSMRETDYVGYCAKGLYVGLGGFLVAATFLHAQQEKTLWLAVFMTAALERIVALRRAKVAPGRAK